MFLLPDHIRRQVLEGAILISPYAFRNSAGSLAMFAAIRLASSFVSKLRLKAGALGRDH
jgi:hypothetical protein